MLVGQLDESARILQDALRVAREQGNQAVVVRALNDEGERLRLKGDHAGARKLFDEATQIAAKLGDRSLVARTKVNQALLSTRDPQRAAAAAAALGSLSQEADAQGLRYLAIESALGKAEALLTAGQAAAAGVDAQRALTRAENLGLRMLRARAHYLSAKAAQSTGGAAAARRHFSEARRILEEARKEDKASEIGRRVDVAEMLSESLKAVR